MILKMLMNRKGRGFTLIELLVVIAIIGILASIAIPVLLGQKTKAMVLEADNNLIAIFTANENYYADNGRYAPWPDDSDPDSTGLKTYKVAPDPLEDELTGLKFSEDSAFKYEVTSLDFGQQFQAVATGKDGTRVAGIVRKLNDKNESDF